jgi:hypothetical protein
MNFEQSTRKNKRFVAIFPTGERIHFGQRGGTTYIDGENDTTNIKRRENYLARHGKEKELWKNPMTPAALSRWILWGPYTQIQANIAFFKNMFRLY